MIELYFPSCWTDEEIVRWISARGWDYADLDPIIPVRADGIWNAIAGCHIISLAE